MNNAKESAYRYDLFITPEWRDRFDTLINDNIKLPTEGRALDVNCGTGAYTIELAERMKGKGEAVGVDPSAERIEIARAKALVKKTKQVQFEHSVGSVLQFNEEFDMVVGDASMLRTDEIESVLEEMSRVVRPNGQVILKLATRGSFDEFFSIYWEAIHDFGIDDEVWSLLERLINERRTISDAALMAERTGLKGIESFVSKEEFSFDSATGFLESPLIADFFLSEWLGIVPVERRGEVLRDIATIIDRERGSAPFDVSIKATVIAGRK